MNGRARSAPPTVRRFHLDGPTIALDSRTHAVRRDIADIRLADRIFAPHYSKPDICTCGVPATMILAAPDERAQAVSQLILGEQFAVVDMAGEWAWGYGLHDDYVGYVRRAALGPCASEPAWRICTASALSFASADIKSPVQAVWPIGSQFAGEAVGAFVEHAAGFIHHRHVAAIGAREGNPVAIAESLVGMPYLWGGRGGGGIDCSGLVQVAFGACGVAVPRDSDQQCAALGRAVEDDETSRRGDILFFPGHVGMMVDRTRIVHANAHWMRVTIEPLADVVARAGGVEPVRRRIGA